MNVRRPEPEGHPAASQIFTLFQYTRLSNRRSMGYGWRFQSSIKVIVIAAKMLVTDNPDGSSILLPRPTLFPYP